MIGTFHNHSKWSDGGSTFSEMFSYADSHGVDILGISDHFCVYPDGTSPDWSLSPIRLRDYLAEVRSFVGKSAMEIRIGLEFDWFENHRDTIAPYVESALLDYRIGAVHHVERQQFDVSTAYWTKKSQEERDQIFIKYWALIRELAGSSLFDIAAHLDLPKKLGFHAEADISGHIGAALDAIRDNNMAIELNTAGYSKPCADGYPSLDILQRCRKREIPVTLSSDGHRPEHLLFEFERGVAQLHQAGYTSIARFRERTRWFEPLSDALKSGRG